MIILAFVILKLAIQVIYVSFYITGLGLPPLGSYALLFVVCGRTN